MNNNPTAPNITPSDVEAAIASEHYYTGSDGASGAGSIIAAEFYSPGTGHAIVDYTEHTHVGHLSAEKGYERLPLVHRPEPSGPLSGVMHCTMVLKNGHVVTGEALLQDLSKPDPERARASARRRAFDKAYDMVVYAERERLVREATKPATFQERVRAEAAELDDRIEKLTAFLSTEAFGKLPAAEQNRMTSQQAAMLDYSDCLAARIKAFGGAA